MPFMTAPAIDGVAPELAARFPGFVRTGIDLPTLIEATRNAGNPANPAWPEIMSTVGERHFARAESAEREGGTVAAERAYLDASFWFFFARFPHILNEGGARAYRRHNEAYGRAAKYFHDPMTRVAISLGDKSSPALLRLPRGMTAPAPLVLISGGIDVWKSDLELHFQCGKFLRRGIATLAIDIPGTGEAPIPTGPNAERLHRAALDWAKQDRRIDAARLGIYGLSFGGYYATKLALTDPTLKGVVNVGGPIHLSFTDENFARLPFPTRMALARILGLDPRGEPAALLDGLRPLSLAAQGLLAAQAHAPLLSINGELDELVPIGEIHWLSEQGVRQDILTFARDRHCASDNWSEHAPFAAAWLARKLAA